MAQGAFSSSRVEVSQVRKRRSEILSLHRNEFSGCLPVSTVRQDLQPLQRHDVREETPASFSGGAAFKGVCKDESSAGLAEELGLSRTTVHELRKEIQENAQELQPTSPLEDEHTETDEMYQSAGEKRGASSRPC